MHPHHTAYVAPHAQAHRMKTVTGQTRQAVASLNKEWLLLLTGGWRAGFWVGWGGVSRWCVCVCVGDGDQCVAIMLCVSIVYFKVLLSR
jgi:hypothetical protein